MYVCMYVPGMYRGDLSVRVPLLLASNSLGIGCESFPLLRAGRLDLVAYY